MHVGSGAQDTNATGTTATFGFTATAGNLLVFMVSSNATITTPSGWTLSAGCAQVGSNAAYLWWKIAAGTETSLIYTNSSASVSAWNVGEYSGLTGSPYDNSNGSVSTTGATTMTTGPITPTAGARLVIASISGARGGAVFTQSTWLNSFTEQADANTSGAVQDTNGQAFADLAATYDGSTAVSSGSTYSQTVTARTGIIIAFKVSSGAKSAPPFGALFRPRFYSKKRVV